MLKGSMHNFGFIKSQIIQHHFLKKKKLNKTDLFSNEPLNLSLFRRFNIIVSRTEKRHEFFSLT